jgi:hypothetical protein
MVNPIIKFGIPIVGIITVGLFLKQAFGSSLGQAGQDVGSGGSGIGSAIEKLGAGIGSVPANILGGFGQGLSGLSAGIASFTSLFGIGTGATPTSVESGATNPVVRQRFEAPFVASTSTTASSNNDSLARPSWEQPASGWGF